MGSGEKTEVSSLCVAKLKQAKAANYLQEKKKGKRIKGSRLFVHEEREREGWGEGEIVLIFHKAP